MIRLILEDNSVFEVTPDHFPDKTLHLELIDELYYEPWAIEWIYEGDDELFTLICIRKHFNRDDLSLILPYIPHARMDRVKNSTEVFTLKHFCDIINDLNFCDVRVLDAHSSVSVALLKNVIQLKINDFILQTLTSIVCDIGGNCNHETREKVYNNLTLFFPDEGAMKRYSKMFPDFPYAFGIKDRDWKTGKINGLNIINGKEVRDRHILIIDDICSRGGTFYHSAKALKNAGAKNIYLYVTHCENTVYRGEMYREDLIKQIYTTDSLIREEDPKNKITTFEIF